MNGVTGLRVKYRRMEHNGRFAFNDDGTKRRIIGDLIGARLSVLVTRV